MAMHIYKPNKHLRLGIRIWPVMVKELLESRELVIRLFLRNWAVRYKQAALGYLWAVIMPFIAIGTFVYLNRAGILNIGATDIPYPLFALIGLSVWQLFSTGLNSGCNSLVSAGDMIAKVNFPREVLVIASLAQAVFEFLVKFVLIIILFFIYKFLPPWQIIFFPLAILPILILTLGLALFLSLLNGVLRDTANIVALLTTFLMFLTPVLYPVSLHKSIFFRFNPLTSLVNAPREIIMYGRIISPMEFFIASVVSVMVFLISWRIFHLVETKIPERI